MNTEMNIDNNRKELLKQFVDLVYRPVEVVSTSGEPQGIGGWHEGWTPEKPWAAWYEKPKAESGIVVGTEKAFVGFYTNEYEAAEARDWYAYMSGSFVAWAQEEHVKGEYREKVQRGIGENHLHHSLQWLAELPYDGN